MCKDFLHPCSTARNKKTAISTPTYIDRERSVLPIWQVGKFSLPAFALDYTLLSVCLQTSAWMSGHHQVLIKCCLSHRARLLNIKGCNANRLSTYRRFVHLYQELYRSMVHPAGHGESGEWWRDGELSWGKWYPFDPAERLCCIVSSGDAGMRATA